MTPSPKFTPDRPPRRRLASGVRQVAVPRAAEGPAERSARISEKMRASLDVLHALAPNDSRAGLLAAAFHRRDEALLDAVLADLRARPSVARVGSGDTVDPRAERSTLPSPPPSSAR